MLLASCLLILSLSFATTSSLVVTKAKVKGPGYTVLAKNGKACASLCKSQPACDSANYNKETNKCRIFSRCSPSLIVFNSTSHLHFSKRPLITEHGYRYHAGSDSCLKLVEELTDYAGAEALCRSKNGRLVALTDESINSLAAEMLSGSQAQFAWVGATDSRWEGNPLLSDGRRVSETGWFPAGSQEMRKDPRRNCWSLSDEGTWSEHPCKGRTQFSICQITAFDNA